MLNLAIRMANDPHPYVRYEALRSLKRYKTNHFNKTEPFKIDSILELIEDPVPIVS